MLFYPNLLLAAVFSHCSQTDVLTTGSSLSIPAGLDLQNISVSTRLAILPSGMIGIFSGWNSTHHLPHIFST